jgi:sugar phosphate isomerase/epimerase
MRLTASTYSFEAIPLEGTLAICKAMGFKAVDIAGFHQRGRASYEPDDVGAQPQKYADHLKRLLDTYELVAMDFFPQFATNFAIRSLNDPDPAVRQQNTTSFRGIVQFCKLVGMHTVTILPGVDHPQKPLQENLDLAAEMLRVYAAIAGEHGIKLCFEPHMGSVALTPELARWLVERAPGAHVTLDYSHFLLQYIPMERIHTLIPVTGHFHIRQAKPGALQTRYSEGTVDFVDVARRLQAVGYNGAMSIEYVCADWYGANQIDTLTETAATKDALQDTIPV